MSARARTLALNGAGRVHVEIRPDAVVVTPANGSPDCVASRIAAAVVDLYPLVPDARRDVIVTSRCDECGRSAVEHLIGSLPRALADDGAAYFLQLSIVSQQRTAEVLERGAPRVVDFAFLPFPDDDRRSAERADAYHLRLAGSDMIVAYLLDIFD